MSACDYLIFIIYQIKNSDNKYVKKSVNTIVKNVTGMCNLKVELRNYCDDKKNTDNSIFISYVDINDTCITFLVSYSYCNNKKVTINILPEYIDINDKTLEILTYNAIKMNPDNIFITNKGSSKDEVDVDLDHSNITVEDVEDTDNDNVSVKYTKNDIIKQRPNIDKKEEFPIDIDDNNNKIKPIQTKIETMKYVQDNIYINDDTIPDDNTLSTQALNELGNRLVDFL